MPNEGFNTFIQGLGAASTPLTGAEELYILQGSASTTITYANLVNSLFPAWTNYTPILSTTTGTVTSTGTVAGRYQHFGNVTGSNPLIGKTVIIEIVGSIINNGTGSGAITLTLPFAAKQGIVGDIPGIFGRENGVSGKSLNTKWVTTTQISVTNYDNTYPGAAGAVIALSGLYEAA